MMLPDVIHAMSQNGDISFLSSQDGHVEDPLAPFTDEPEPNATTTAIDRSEANSLCAHARDHSVIKEKILSNRQNFPASFLSILGPHKNFEAGFDAIRSWSLDKKLQPLGMFTVRRGSSRPRLQSNKMTLSRGAHEVRNIDGSRIQDACPCLVKLEEGPDDFIFIIEDGDTYVYKLFV